MSGNLRERCDGYEKTSIAGKKTNFCDGPPKEEGRLCDEEPTIEMKKLWALEKIVKLLDSIDERLLHLVSR